MGFVLACSAGAVSDSSYYAGHGLQVDGRNYLIPVGADLRSETDVKFKAVDAGFVLGHMVEAKASLNIVILDASRDHPFERSFCTSSRGLAQIEVPSGELGQPARWTSIPGWRLWCPSRRATWYVFRHQRGTAAGQAVMHLHVHLIPRYCGDQRDPRGGVRRIFPEVWRRDTCLCSSDSC